MRASIIRSVCIIVCLTFPAILFAQDAASLYDKIQRLPDQLFKGISNKSQKLQDQLTHQTEKYLKRFARRESRLKRKLYKLDSNTTKKVFDGSGARYAVFKRSIKENAALNEIAHGEYMASLDSLKGCLSFLEKNGRSFTSLPDAKDRIQTALTRVNQLQSRFHKADEIKEFVRDRKQQLQNAINQYNHLPKSVLKGYGDFSKEVYYYSQQVREYKELLNSPTKLQQRALSLLNQLPAFQQFMKEHGELAGLFNVPASYRSAGSLAGLQTRDQVQQLIQNQIASGGPNANQIFSQNLQAAQAQLNQFKDKLSKLGGGSGDMDMPNFKPNNQRTKSFLKRLEYGSNLQTARADFFFPTTTDIALSVGYKLNDKSTIGIGASYKLGWGKDIRHIAITSQGMGLRSLADVKLKGSFYVSGGFEYNYQKPFNSLAHLYTLNDWQQSGLAGISKIISVKSKLFKKTKMQLLWDFLSYHQLPRSQPLKFRIGYTFN